MDFDETRLYYSHQQLQRPRQETDPDEGIPEDDDAVDLQAVRRHFREFLRKWWLAVKFECFVLFVIDSHLN